LTNLFASLTKFSLLVGGEEEQLVDLIALSRIRMGSRGGTSIDQPVARNEMPGGPLAAAGDDGGKISDPYRLTFVAGFVLAGLAVAARYVVYHHFIGLGGPSRTRDTDSPPSTLSRKFRLYQP